MLDPATPKRTSHDRIFKQLLSVFWDDLVSLLSPELDEWLQFEPGPGKFIESEAFTDFIQGPTAEADLVARGWAREDVLRPVLVQVEVEGQFLHSTAERLWRYTMHLRLKYYRSVIMIVLFLKGGPPGATWNHVEDRVGSLVLERFNYLSFGLSGASAEEYLERPEPLAAALAALMRSEDRVEQKLCCLRKISRAPVSGSQRYLLAKIVETYLQLEGEDAERFAAEIAKKKNEEIRKMEITWEETLAAREARGKAQGQIKEARSALVRLLEFRFGALPAEILARIEAIGDLDRLHELHGQALAVEALEALNFS